MSKSMQGLQAAGSTLRSPSGFSLIELLIASALISILLEGAVYAYLHVLKSSSQSRAQSLVEQDLDDLGVYLSFRIQNIGGGAVRPWSALWVEDSARVRGILPDGAGSDRVTFAEIDPTLAACNIVNVDTSIGSTVLIFDASTGTCCLNAFYNNRQVILTNGSYYSQLFFTAVNPVACTAQFSPGQGYTGMNSLPPLPSGWIGGVATVVTVSTLYLDPNTHTLHQFQDQNNNGIIDSNEDLVLIENIMDFQIALAYDCCPQDGNITDSQNDADEWLYNSNGPNETLGKGGLAGGSPSDLRMISIGFVSGEQSPLPPYSSISVLNGPTRQINGWRLQKSLIRVRFRNVGTFMQNG